MKKKLAEVSQDEALMAVKILCIACINTNATTMTIEQKGVNIRGQKYGDFKIVVNWKPTK